MAVLTQKNNHEALVTQTFFSFLVYDRVTITMWKPCTNNKLEVNIKLTDS